jgi:hypothetical protein
VQNELIKFRVRADEKQILSEAVGKAGMTLSNMLRRTGRAAAAGRIAPRAVLTDLVLIRTAANRLASLANASEADPAAIVACIKRRPRTFGLLRLAPIGHPLRARYSARTCPAVLFRRRTLENLVGQCGVVTAVAKPNLADLQFQFWT